jgi:hypothetical protein
MTSGSSKKLQTIEEIWQGYAKACYPDGMTEIQERQVRQAFVAGFTSMKVITEIISMPNVTEKDGVELLDFYTKECDKEVKRYSERKLSPDS